MKGLLAGIGDGIMRFLFFGSNALAFWYGVKLVLEDRQKADKEYTPAVLMIVCHLQLSLRICILVTFVVLELVKLIFSHQF